MYASPSKPLEAADIERRLAAHKASSTRNASPVRRLVGSLESGIRGRPSTLQNTMSAKSNSRYIGSPHLSHLSPPPSPPPSTPPPPAPRGKNRRLEIGLPRASTTPNLPVSTPSFLLSPVTTPRGSRGPPPKRPPRPSSELFLPPMPSPVVKTFNPSPLSRLAEKPSEAPSPPPTAPPPAVPSRPPLRQATPAPKSMQHGRDRVHPLFSQSPNLRSNIAPSSSSARATSPSSRVSSSTASIQSAAVTSEITYENAVSQLQDLIERGRDKSRQFSISTATSGAPETLFEFPIVPIARSSTAPPSLERLNSRARSNLNLAPGPRSPRLQMRHASKASARSLDTHLLNAGKKSPLQRQKTSSSLRAALLDLDERARAKRNAVTKPLRPTIPAEVQNSSRRKRKGETMSMLLDTGFFPVKELIYGNGKVTKMRESAMYRINLPPRLSFLDRDLPQTPGTTGNSPVEFYQYSPTSPRRRSRYRRSVGAGRRPLSQISENGVFARNDELRRESVLPSPGRGLSLAAIPENSTNKENTAPASGIATPVTTQIHLRGGSVLTVTPPELTAWKPTVYLLGPIKLPKPAIMPRKNSVASLEPFQEAVDQVYQHALSIPRRRSDDAVTDDICEFFDDFGFDTIMLGDQLLHSIDEISDVEEADGVAERFSTPPTGLPLEMATPVEVIIAKEVLARPPPVPQQTIPPVETEETLRERGIARLARWSRSSAGSASGESPAGRKESLILGNSEEGGARLPLLPAPEESMLEAVLKPAASTPSVSARGGSSISYAQSEYSSHTATTGEYSGFDWNDEDVQEMGGFEPGPISKSAKNLSSRRTRNPIKKIRQAVALANAAL